ncbi:MAG: lipoyl(octanoyl) transferase LipB, partial [Thermodesulfobacteriota bacterium]|nr:lipoyl(octanoyl) transferase LipB [Thermodesulfobacteriota bacterium]
LQVVVLFLADYDINGYIKDGEPGVWVEGRKICSFGIAIKKWITSHGIALNINNSLETFTTIVPCGRPNEVMTSLSRELGETIDLVIAKKRFIKHFCAAFNYYEKIDV